MYFFSPKSFCAVMIASFNKFAVCDENVLQTWNVFQLFDNAYECSWCLWNTFSVVLFVCNITRPLRIEWIHHLCYRSVFLRPLGRGGGRERERNKTSVSPLCQGSRFRKFFFLKGNACRCNAEITILLCPKTFLHISLCTSRIGMMGWTWGFIYLFWVESDKESSKFFSLNAFWGYS